MREDPLGRDSTFDGARHSDGNKRQTRVWGDHVKTVFGHSRGMVPTRRCVMFLLHIGVRFGIE